VCACVRVWGGVGGCLEVIHAVVERVDLQVLITLKPRVE